MSQKNLFISTPGRICLFGEHQDYLGLPVIAAAISRRISIEAHRTIQPDVCLSLPDMGDEARFSIAHFPLDYAHKRDYFRSALNVLHRQGFRFSAGISGTVTGNIPINAGTSSSSALLVTWLNVLSQLADEPTAFSARELAELAYAAEVLEFGEPGGMMDHYATAVGGIIYLESTPKIHLESFSPVGLGTFVLGDSREPKDTIGVLRHVKYGMLGAINKMRTFNPAFSFDTMPTEAVADYAHRLTPDELTLVKGNLSDRDVLRQALSLFRNGPVNQCEGGPEWLGQLLTLHQNSLRDAKRVSTPKIDRMIDAALGAGALGAKINGSGGGGCMFAYAPAQAHEVAEAIQLAGGHAYIVSIDAGTGNMPLTDTLTPFEAGFEKQPQVNLVQ